MKKTEYQNSILRFGFFITFMLIQLLWWWIMNFDIEWSYKEFTDSGIVICLVPTTIMLMFLYQIGTRLKKYILLKILTICVCIIYGFVLIYALGYSLFYHFAWGWIVIDVALLLMICVVANIRKFCMPEILLYFRKVGRRYHANRRTIIRNQAILAVFCTVASLIMVYHIHDLKYAFLYASATTIPLFICMAILLWFSSMFKRHVSNIIYLGIAGYVTFLI